MYSALYSFWITPKLVYVLCCLFFINIYSVNTTDVYEVRWSTGPGLNLHWFLQTLVLCKVAKNFKLLFFEL